ncbi:hypothetical protein B0H67DRAFT_678389 [Lasiosphaeris hirsuta]|uniref:HMG box domain-containing protein n=1 Tax=Lasiosphaeris hirsuta TaxID=260670 RepID=A0AA40EAY3_9PEZI|nr:hypothetical protein B0H67DRAFT_678389 [Lasiosphaeris hirsuta]
MEHNTPPSPAPSKADPIPSGFHELLQHNAAVSYTREGMSAEPPQAHSQPVSRYGSPGAQGFHGQTYDPGLVYRQRGGGGQLQGYHQSMYSHDSSPYGPIPEAHQPYSTPATSPRTPSRASDIVTTRSGNTVRRGNSSKVLGPKSTRIEKTGSKKKERAKPVNNMPAYDKPMSELTKDSQTPVADIGAYVNRSAEVRRREIETGKNPGRVKRPMNAFMLYRKAYQQRAKELASQHNHQVVSRVCGSSWPLEPESVRAQFKQWADTERENHQKAHPDYKFKPAKPQKQKYKDGKFGDSDGSDLEDYDWAGRHASHTRSATRTPNDDGDDDYIPPRSVYSGMPSFQFGGMHGVGGLAHQNRSAFEFSNPGKPMPAPYDHRDLPGQYYETHVRNPSRHLHHGMVEDVLMRKTPSPSLAFASSSSGHHLLHHQQYDASQYHPQSSALEPQPHLPQQPQRFEHRIDPSLMPHEGISLYDASNLNNLLFENGLPGPQQAWQQPTHLVDGADEDEHHYAEAYLSLHETLSIEQQAQFLQGADEWQIEALPETAQFDTSWGSAGRLTARSGLVRE